MTGGAPAAPRARRNRPAAPPTSVHGRVTAASTSRSSTTRSPSPTGRRPGLRYREVEVEVVECRRLCSAGRRELVRPPAPRPSSSQSKGVRALVGDAPLDPAGRRSATAPGPRTPPPTPCSYHVRTQVARSSRRTSRPSRHLPDAVHQFRVAARRLRSVLQAFAPLVDDGVGALSCAPSSAGSPSVLGAVTRPRGARGAAVRHHPAAAPATSTAPLPSSRSSDHLEAELDEANAPIDAGPALPPRYLRRCSTLLADDRGRSRRPPSWPTSKASQPCCRRWSDQRWRKLAKQGAPAARRARGSRRPLAPHPDHRQEGALHRRGVRPGLRRPGQEARPAARAR